MVKDKKIGPLSIAIILIILGTLLLMINLGKYDGVENIITLWPLGFILLGVEYFLWSIYYKTKGEETNLAFHFASVITLMTIVLCGSLAHLFVKSDFYPAFQQEVLSQAYQYTDSQEESHSAENIKEVRITNNYGNVKLLPTSSNEIEVKLTKKSYGTSFENAKQRNEEIKLIASKGEILKISTELKEFKGNNHQLRCDLVVRIPKQVNVDLNSDSAEVEAFDLTNEHYLINCDGNLSVRLPIEPSLVLDADAIDGRISLNGKNVEVKTLTKNYGEGKGLFRLKVNRGEIAIHE